MIDSAADLVECAGCVAAGYRRRDPFRPARHPRRGRLADRGRRHDRSCDRLRERIMGRRGSGRRRRAFGGHLVGRSVATPARRAAHLDRGRDGAGHLRRFVDQCVRGAARSLGRGVHLRRRAARRRPACCDVRRAQCDRRPGRLRPLPRIPADCAAKRRAGCRGWPVSSSADRRAARPFARRPRAGRTLARLRRTCVVCRRSRHRTFRVADRCGNRQCHRRQGILVRRRGGRPCGAGVHESGR